MRRLLRKESCLSFSCDNWRQPGKESRLRHPIAMATLPFAPHRAATSPKADRGLETPNHRHNGTFLLLFTSSPTSRDEKHIVHRPVLNPYVENHVQLLTPIPLALLSSHGTMTRLLTDNIGCVLSPTPGLAGAPGPQVGTLQTLMCLDVVSLVINNGDNRHL